MLTEVLTADKTLPWEGGISPGRIDSYDGMSMHDDGTDRVGRERSPYLL